MNVPDHTSIRFSEDERQIIAAILSENPHLQGKVARAVSFALYNWRKEANKMSNSPASIAIYVIEQGRVVGDPQGEEWLESLEIEVEFEARERGLSNSERIAKEAVKIYHRRK